VGVYAPSIPLVSNPGSATDSVFHIPSTGRFVDCIVHIIDDLFIGLFCVQLTICAWTSVAMASFYMFPTKYRRNIFNLLSLLKFFDYNILFKAQCSTVCVKMPLNCIQSTCSFGLVFLYFIQLC